MKNFSSRKKESFHRSSPKEIGKIALIVALIVFLLLFGRGIFGAFVSSMTTPAYMLRTWFLESSATIPTYFRDRNELLGEIDRLQESLSEKSGSTATIARIAAENAELRTLLGSTTPEEERILASVITRPPYLPYDAVMLDRGSRDGIKEGAVVYHAKDHAIGIISRVYANSSLVTLFSTPNVETTVFIVGPDIYTTAYGNGGGVVRVSVPQGIELTEGDIVLLPALEGGVMGTLSSIRSEPTRPEQDGFIVGVVPMQSLHIVSVGTRVLEEVSFEDARIAVQSLRESYLKLDVPEGVLVETGTSTATSTPATSTVQTRIVP